MLDTVLKIVSSLIAEAPQASARTARRAADFRSEAGKRASQFGREASRRAADMRDEVADRVHSFEKKVSKAIHKNDSSDTLENVALFVTGLGVGVGLALLLTPSSGADLRNGIRNRAAEMIDSFRESYRQAVDDSDEERYMGV